MGRFENGGLGIIVNCYYLLGVNHTRLVLNRTGNAAGDIESGPNRSACLTYLVVVMDEPSVNRGPGCTNRPTQAGCKVKNELEVFFFSDSGPPGDDDACRF